MTREDKKKLEPILAPLRSLVGRKEFMELAMAYTVRPMSDGIAVIAVKEEPADLKKLFMSHPDCCWCHYLTYENLDEILLWIQRDGEDLREKYKKLTETVQEALSFLNGREYGWGERQEEE